MTDTSPDTSPDASNKNSSSILEVLAGRSDIMLAVAIVFMLGLLLLPVPTWFLDFSLAVSITFAVIILMTVLFLKDPHLGRSATVGQRPPSPKFVYGSSRET